MLNKQDVADIQLENRRLRQKHEAAIMSLELARKAAVWRRDNEPDRLVWHELVASYDHSIGLLTGQREIKV